MNKDNKKVEVTISLRDYFIYWLFEISESLYDREDPKTKAEGERVKKIAQYLTQYLIEISATEGYPTQPNFELTFKCNPDTEEVINTIKSYFTLEHSVQYAIAKSLGKGEEYLNAINKKGGQGSNKHIKIAIHAVSQFYGDNKQLSIFSDEKIDVFSRATGLSINNKPDSYGVVLNQAQERVLYGILNAFSNTNYKGDEEIDKLESLDKVMNVGSETMRQAIKKPYENIKKIPVVKLTQAQIIDLSGYDLKSQRQGDKQDVIDAFFYLLTNPNYDLSFKKIFKN
jgi:hypothetical protein